VRDDRQERERWSHEPIEATWTLNHEKLLGWWVRLVLYKYDDMIWYDVYNMHLMAYGWDVLCYVMKIIRRETLNYK